MAMKNAKPNFSQSLVTEIVKRLYSLTPSEIRSLPSYDDQNFYVSAVEGGEYVLKIMNSEDSKNQTMFEVQSHVMAFLHQNGLPSQTPLPNTSGQLMSLEEAGRRSPWTNAGSFYGMGESVGGQLEAICGDNVQTN